MKLRLLEIDVLAVPGKARSSPVDVRIRLDLDGKARWFTMTVRPRVLRGFDASLVVASEELQDVLRLEQNALHRICKLVGREVRGRTVRLPQQVAA